MYDESNFKVYKKSKLIKIYLCPIIIIKKGMKKLC